MAGGTGSHSPARTRGVISTISTTSATCTQHTAHSSELSQAKSVHSETAAATAAGMGGRMWQAHCPPQLEPASNTPLTTMISPSDSSATTTSATLAVVVGVSSRLAASFMPWR